MTTTTTLHSRESLSRTSPAPPVDVPTDRRLVARLSSWRFWAASTAVFVAFATALFGSRLPFSIPTVESACGQAPPDVRFHTSAAAVNDFLAGCGDSGRGAYTSLQLADLVYPAVFGLFVVTSLVVVLSRLDVGHRVLVALVAVPAVGTAFDYLENVFAWRALAEFPDATGTDGLLGLASAAKTTTFWSAGLLLIGASGLLVFRTIRARRQPGSGRRSLDAPA